MSVARRERNQSNKRVKINVDDAIEVIEVLASPRSSWSPSYDVEDVKFFPSDSSRAPITPFQSQLERQFSQRHRLERQISVDSSRLAPFPRYSINSFTFLFTKIFLHVIVEYSQQDLFLMNCLLKTGLCFLKSKIQSSCKNHCVPFLFE